MIGQDRLNEVLKGASRPVPWVEGAPVMSDGRSLVWDRLSAMSLVLRVEDSREALAALGGYVAVGWPAAEVMMLTTRRGGVLVTELYRIHELRPIDKPEPLAYGEAAIAVAPALQIVHRPNEVRFDAGDFSALGEHFVFTLSEAGVWELVRLDFSVGLATMHEQQWMERVERGYVWPLSAARDRESGSVYGVGMRVGPFRLAANLRELAEGQPEEYMAPKKLSHEEWVAMIDEKVEAVEAYAGEVGRLERHSLQRSIAGTIVGLANQYLGWLDPKASVIEFGFTDDHAARLESLAGWTELVHAYETEWGR